MFQDKADLLRDIGSTVSGAPLRKAVHQVRYQKLKKGVIFEEANPVSLSALKSIHTLCGLLLAGGFALFFVEEFVSVRQKFKRRIVELLYALRTAIAAWFQKVKSLHLFS